MSDDKDQLICIATITSAHGIKGEVKIKSFTEDPFAIEQYSPIYTNNKQETLNISITGTKGDTLIAKIDGITTRNEAENLRNTNLYILRSILPKNNEGEFYHIDLIGLTVLDTKKNEFGKIIFIHNFGAGDIVEIKLKNSNKTELFTFNNETFPEIDLDKQTITIDPPEIDFAKNEQ